MANNLSPEAVLKSYEAAFPNKSGLLFYYLWNDIVHLHLDWMNYRSLFGTSPERIDLLKQTASSFFARQEIILRHDILTRIIRLADDAKTLRKDNASLRKLLNDIKGFISEELQAELENDYVKFKEDTKKIKILRDKKIAHADYLVVLKYIEPLPSVSRLEIEEALDDIRTLMNKIEMHFKKATTAFEYPISSNQAESLIWALEKAQKYIQNEREEKQRKYGIRPDSGTDETDA